MAQAQILLNQILVLFILKLNLKYKTYKTLWLKKMNLNDVSFYLKNMRNLWLDRVMYVLGWVLICFQNSSIK